MSEKLPLDLRVAHAPRMPDAGTPGVPVGVLVVLSLIVIGVTMALWQHWPWVAG